MKSIEEGGEERKPELFADIIIPIPVPNLFTYSIPEEFEHEIIPGKRVLVPFGKHKVYSGIVRRIHGQPGIDLLKSIHAVLDDEVIVNPVQFEFWDWITAYYMCHPGEVMNAALPSALKLQSETCIIYNPEFREEEIVLSDEESYLLEFLQERNELSLEEVGKFLRKKNVHPVLSKLIEKGAVFLKEEIDEVYRPKLESRISLVDKYQSETALELLFLQMDQDKRRQKQLENLMIFLKNLYSLNRKDYVKKTDLIKDPAFSVSALQTLLKQNVLQETKVRIDRVHFSNEDMIPAAKLSPVQENAAEEIREQWKNKDVICLHGVTSSGKTEVYIHLIDEAMKSGKQVLYLLPEIALTTQIITRLRKHFGNTVGVYHSRYSNNERVEIWNNVLKFSSDFNKGQLILGARSALFLPFKNLGLIIVDEEHDSSYKQADPAPRYNARDASIMLAKFHGCKVLLGSATPSMETYHNAETGKFGLVKMMERFGGIKLPKIIIADLSEAKRKKMMRAHFTPELMQAISNALSLKEQIILFQNRRGFSPYIECDRCAWIPHCKNCSVTLTYHKASHQLKCHYCGFSMHPPASCQQCGDFKMEVRGFGTEKIEEDIGILFPDAKVARMDLDATRTRNSFQQLINEFSERKIDILVGTQMVTKGLDFDNVSTIGIVNADQLINFPDFRAFERSFQLMAQVSGRSGRKQKQGFVVIQTSQVQHWVITDVVNNDYQSFFNRDLEERRKFNYPPHSRLIELVLKYRDRELLDLATNQFSELIRQKLGNRVYGPHIPVVYRVKNEYLKSFLIKLEKSISASAAKGLIRDCINTFYSQKEFQRIRIQIDVDPL